MTSAAVRDLEVIEKQNRRLLARISRAIDGLATAPCPPNAHKLRGAQDIYRIRVADYRIVYKIERRRIVVTVVRVGHRRQAYKRLR